MLGTVALTSAGVVAGPLMQTCRLQRGAICSSYREFSPGLDTPDQVTHYQLSDRCCCCRYVDWFLTTPLLLLDLLILTDITVATTIWIMAADIFMIVFGLFGAVSDHKTK